MPTKKTTKKPEHLNPLDAYTTAIEVLMGAAKGQHRSRIRVEAAQTPLEHSSTPPNMDWGFVADEGEDE